MSIFNFRRLAGIAEIVNSLAVGVLLKNKNVRVLPFRTFRFFEIFDAIKPDDCEEKRYWDGWGQVEVSPLSPEFF